MNMNDIIYVYIAYTIIFAGLAAYTFYLHTKQIKLTRDVELLGELVKTHGKRKKK
jgi:CcmD family protein